MKFFFRNRHRNKEVIKLDFPNSLYKSYPESGIIAHESAKKIWELIKSNPLDELSKNSPGLRGYDWQAYLELSSIRVAHAFQALKFSGISKGKILDIGSYFGNFSLAFKNYGYEVDALDSYSAYGRSFLPIVNALTSEKINIYDFSSVGFDLSGLEHNKYDAVLFMGVIEHIAHTPKHILNSINKVLKKNGVLILDTPNLAYEYKRRIACAGGSNFPPISDQFDCESQFEGHHREYTTDEIEWILQRIGHQILYVDHFNYSSFWLKELTGDEVENYKKMQSDPRRREIILTASRKLNEN